MTFQDVEHLSYPDLLDCKQDTLGRLQGIVIKDVPRKKAGKQKNAASNGIPYTPKTDTHWDFLMKEMMWLGADFQGERKRQLSLAKKLASSVKQYHKTKEARRLRELQQAETKRRKLSAKISRDVKSWWIKIERVISYKQKIKADEERQKAMNKQLVVLVQQTERYSESLTKYRGEDTTDSDDDDTSMNSDSDVQTKGKRRRKRLTIEEALAMERKRKSKHKVVDYARMRLDNKAFYGESTASDSGSDASYAPESDTDDQTTLKEAMDDELLERKQSGTGNEIVFQADPEELRKLREEIEMDIQQVIDRFKLEGMVEIPEETESQSDPVNTQNKRVQFPETASEPVDTDKMDVDDPPLVKSEHVDPGNDADDDGDASDVEDYKHTQSDEDEFSDCEPEVDDETTIAQEEILPREISTQQEIDLLRKESEMSVEELRKLYSGMNEDAESSGEVSEEDEDAIDETINDDDKEFCLPVTAEVDDETTIEAEEKLGTEMSHDEEMALLQQDSNIPIEQLRAMSAAMENANGGTSSDDQVSDSNGTKKDFGGTHGSLTAALASQISEREGDFSDEFQPEASETVDDETTIEAEERLGRELSYDEEMNLLKNESEIPVEQLRAMYADVNGQSSQETNAEEYHTNAIKEAAEKLERAMAFIKTQNERPIEQLRSMYQAMADEAHDDESDATEITGSANGPASATVALLSSAGDVDVENDEYKPNAAEGIDDETTIEAEERLGREMSYDDELALLKKEKEMSVEELRAMYANMGSGNGEDDDGDDNDDLERSQNSKMGVDDNGESPSTSLVDTVSKRKRKYKETHDKTKKQRKDEPEADSDDGTNARSALRKDEPEADSDDGTTALSALEASAERARKTLASRPYMLASWVKLRKYQQVGLNWLVSLQSRRLNGILADEMGLGKTLQTIALLSYLASYKGIWGPHLVVVPTSVIINWETELKRFCPALKVLCYYGSAKRRKELRTGWTKTNWYHVVITSYQLVVQDAFAFKRKKWYYLILDEAQNIKNFQSQRWQTLINFNTQRRLLLTGTPLQNSLMELWSLLHFLMPYIFRSRKEFSYWFSNPMNSMIEGNTDRNDGIITKLHGIIRPFVLRRLKKDVETQMPGKFEHVVKCQLSRRQMQLYEEFLSRSSTRKALQKGGNFMGMMNVLMQLRKVCNHPDLFEARSIITPFVMPSLRYTIPSFLCTVQSDKSVVDRLSGTLMQSLWCGSTGLPAVQAALRHNQVEAKQLRRLNATVDKESLLSIEESIDGTCPDELTTLVRAVQAMRHRQKSEKIDFHNAVNSRRCMSTEFPYSLRLLDAVEVEVDVFRRRNPVELRNRDIVLTPGALLEMRKLELDRANQLDGTIEKFVFCVPKAGARAPTIDTSGSVPHEYSSRHIKEIEEVLMDPLEAALNPSRKAQARLSSFFPDKKFIQYDAGKLQMLAELLRKLKRGGHRALIFTQMSKMLDILEAFLNIYGYTYLRLDGATGVDRRQRYMERFNNDTKIFCFILSTRSGGIGINLTGADTVIFYDSDWNPAMDAQAQDRAHRIGQTREVHIYRLITQHTIEENILMKAKQKKNLDIMVMDQGKFDASQPSDPSDDDANQAKDVYTKGGLRAILGVTDNDANNDGSKEHTKEEPADMSNEQMEMAMASLEDDDDVQALQGARKEAAEELEEFDENAEIKKDEDEDDDENGDDNGDESGGRPAKRRKSGQEKKTDDKAKADEQKSEEGDLEKDFAAWQSTVGLDASAVDSALSPMEKYALNFREDIDPFYSIFYINEHNRQMEVAEVKDDIYIEEIEREKAMEERQAMDDGDLLATRPRPEALIRQRNLYHRERMRLRSDKKRRKLTGESWSSKIDGVTQKPFWYNADTGEAIWNKPTILLQLEANDLALQQGWGFLPIKPLVHIMEFLIPLPERQHCSAVCRQWKTAADDIRFVRHVYPVEMGALGRDGGKRLHNHFNTIAEALSIALPGDTIELADGHYWVNEPGLSFDKPLKLVGDESNAANVVVEMSGSLEWKAKGGWIEGVTFRRPKMSTGVPISLPMLNMTGEAKMDMINCVFDNDGSTGSVVTISGSGSKGCWNDIIVRNGGSNGIEMEGEVTLELKKSSVKGNKENGLKCSKKGKFRLLETRVTKNLGFGLDCRNGSGSEIMKCNFNSNKKGVINKESGCTFTCSGNTALVFTPPAKNIPGFKISTISNSISEGGLQNSTS